MLQFPGAFWRQAFTAAAMLFGLMVLTACGGGSTNISNTPSGLEVGDAPDIKAVLSAVPAGGGDDGGGANTVRLHYNRPDASYASCAPYVYGGADFGGGWPGKAADGEVSGSCKYWDISATGASFNFIIVKDGGGTREPSSWSGKTCSDEHQLWAVADGNTVY